MFFTILFQFGGLRGREKKCSGSLQNGRLKTEELQCFATRKPNLILLQVSSLKKAELIWD